METMKNIFLTGLLLFITGIIGCDDSDSSQPLVLQLKEIDILTGKTHQIDILSGNGKYVIETSNPDIIKAKVIDDQYILVEGLKEGKSYLYVKDKSSNKTTLTVRTVKNEYLYDLVHTNSRISDELDDSLKKEIKADLANKNFLIGPSGTALFRFQDGNSGEVLLYPTPYNLFYEGVFKLEGDDNFVRNITLSFDDKELNYLCTYYVITETDPSVTRIDGFPFEGYLFPYYLLLVENYTDHYRNLYPSVSISDLGILKLIYFHPLFQIKHH